MCSVLYWIYDHGEQFLFVWLSKLQSLLALSTMESKYIALSTLCWEVLPLKNLLEKVAKALGVINEKEDICITIWEDNKQALKLAFDTTNSGH